MVVAEFWRLFARHLVIEPIVGDDLLRFAVTADYKKIVPGTVYRYWIGTVVGFLDFGIGEGREGA